MFPLLAVLAAALFALPQGMDGVLVTLVFVWAVLVGTVAWAAIQAPEVLSAARPVPRPVPTGLRDASVRTGSDAKWSQEVIPTHVSDHCLVIETNDRGGRVAYFNCGMAVQATDPDLTSACLSPLLQAAFAKHASDDPAIYGFGREWFKGPRVADVDLGTRVVSAYFVKNPIHRVVSTLLKKIEEGTGRETAIAETIASGVSTGWSRSHNPPCERDNTAQMETNVAGYLRLLLGVRDEAPVDFDAAVRDAPVPSTPEMVYHVLRTELEMNGGLPPFICLQECRDVTELTRNFPEFTVHYSLTDDGRSFSCVLTKKSTRGVQPVHLEGVDPQRVIGVRVDDRVILSVHGDEKTPKDGGLSLNQRVFKGISSLSTEVTALGDWQVGKYQGGHTGFVSDARQFLGESSQISEETRTKIDVPANWLDPQFKADSWKKARSS